MVGSHAAAMPATQAMSTSSMLGRLCLPSPSLLRQCLRACGGHGRGRSGGRGRGRSRGRRRGGGGDGGGDSSIIN